MSETTSPPSQPLEDKFVSFTDIVWRQFFLNKIAARALYSLLVVVFLAITAPLIALNVPYVLWEDGEGVSFPLFIKLFDGLVFANSVDLCFNVALILLPLSGQPLGRYFMEIGLRYLALAAPVLAVGFVLERRMGQAQ